eukprot:IDg12260t1
MRNGYNKNTRIGEVPVWTDRTDPKLYRRLLYYWIRFQDLAPANSPKRLSLGQQVMSVMSNIQGSSGQRIGHIAAYVHLNMTRDDFVNIIDGIMDVIDPQDRVSSFLETAKTWRELMVKGHGKSQSFDSYWLEYSILRIRYAQSHGQVAQSSGVKELLALICVLNARLERTDFSMVCITLHLTSARDGLALGPRTSNAITVETSPLEATGESSSAQNTQETNEHIARLSLSLKDTRRQIHAVQMLLSSLADELGDLSEVSSFVVQLNAARTKLALADGHVKDAMEKNEQLEKCNLSTIDENDTQRKIDNRPNTEQIITMESVRVALRRLDFGEKALRQDSSRNGDRTAHSKTTATKKSIKCWECNGPRYAYQKPECAAL